MMLFEFEEKKHGQHGYHGSSAYNSDVIQIILNSKYQSIGT